MSRDPLTKSASLVEMDQTMRMLAREKAAGNRITITAVAVRAGAIALRAVPRANSRIILGGMRIKAA